MADALEVSGEGEGASWVGAWLPSGSWVWSWSGSRVRWGLDRKRCRCCEVGMWGVDEWLVGVGIRVHG